MTTASDPGRTLAKVDAEKAFAAVPPDDGDPSL